MFSHYIGCQMILLAHTDVLTLYRLSDGIIGTYRCSHIISAVRWYYWHLQMFSHYIGCQMVLLAHTDVLPLYRLSDGIIGTYRCSHIISAVRWYYWHLQMLSHYIGCQMVLLALTDVLTLYRRPETIVETYRCFNTICTGCHIELSTLTDELTPARLSVSVRLCTVDVGHHLHRR